MQIEGRNPVIETLNSDSKVTILFLQNKLLQTDKIRTILSLAQKKGIRIKKIGKNKLKKMSRTGNHQGVIARTTHQFQTTTEVLAKLEKSKKHPFFVIIKEASYQRNLGAIIRTAECAGCSGVIIPKEIKVTAEVARVSMGAIEHIPIIRENLFNAVKQLKDYAVKMIGLEAEGRQTIYEYDLTGPIAMIIGGEDCGITRSLLKKCDEVLKIPLFGKINSLNMSNAAAIALFEKIRQEMPIT